MKISIKLEMSKKLAPYGAYLQDFIARVKYFSASTGDIDEAKVKKGGAVAQLESNKETLKEFEAIATEIRKEGALLNALDNYCAILPTIIKEISTYETEDPPISYVLKNLVVASLNSVISLF